MIPLSTIEQFIYAKFQANQKMLAILIDPDKYTAQSLLRVLRECNTHKVDLILVGGSLITQGKIQTTIRLIKENSNIPALLFPSTTLQIEPNADGILFLSLLSGRNPEYLIGKHVIAAPYLAQTKMQILPTAYLLIDTGKSTTATYMSATPAIPSNKPEIAICTSLAGQYMGMRYVYMDAGSGGNPIPSKMIQEVSSSINIPLIVGGGIRSEEEAETAYNSGADIIVVGNHIETAPQSIKNFTKVRDASNKLIPTVTRL